MIDPTTPEAAERARFEAWARGRRVNIARSRFNPDEYAMTPAQLLWDGWMARAALAAQEGGGERVTERWEPMETAPMDGTVIQFLQGGEVFAGFAGDDPDHPWQFLDRNGRQAFVNGFHHKFSPRWWRPLAEAPKEAALRAAQEGGGGDEYQSAITQDQVDRARNAFFKKMMLGFGVDDCFFAALHAAQEGTSNG